MIHFNFALRVGKLMYKFNYKIKIVAKDAQGVKELKGSLFNDKKVYHQENTVHILITGKRRVR